MGGYLASLTPPPTLVLCSTSVRTRETLDEVLAELDPRPRVIYEDKLYLASAGQLIERLQHLPADVESVLLIGHNPGLQQLAMMLTDDNGELADGFPTSALAMLRMEGTWRSLRPREARLIEYCTPRSLSRDPAFESD